MTSFTSGIQTECVRLCTVHTCWGISLLCNAVLHTPLLHQVTDADAAPHNTSTLSISGDQANVLFGVDSAHDGDGYFNLNLIGGLDVETQENRHMLTITATNTNGMLTAGCMDGGSGACAGSTLTDTATVIINVEVS